MDRPQRLATCAEVWSIAKSEPCISLSMSRKRAPYQQAEAICPKTKKAEVEELLKIAVVDRLPLRVLGMGLYSSKKPFLAYLDVADVPVDRWQEKVKEAFGDGASYLGEWKED